MQPEAAQSVHEVLKNLIPPAVRIALFFIAMFLIGGWLGRPGRELEKHSTGSVLGLAVVAMAFAFVLLGFDQVATTYFLLYGFVLLVQLGVMAVVVVVSGILRAVSGFPVRVPQGVRGAGRAVDRQRAIGRGALPASPSPREARVS